MRSHFVHALLLALAAWLVGVALSTTEVAAWGVRKEHEGDTLYPAYRSRPTTSRPYYPVHPPVSINWTDFRYKRNISKVEAKSILKQKLVLVKLVVVNRHGHRAPNAPYWKMCPNDVNRWRYDVEAEDLTGMGMEEEYKFGQYLRREYRDFLGDRFNRSLHFFRAVGEPRILQSAMAVAQGVFPDGFGPGGFLPSRPQFVPIFSDMDTHEYLLDDVPCFRRAEADSHRWVKENFTFFMEDKDNVKALATMKRVCGNTTGNFTPFAYIKTVADGMTFNYDYGLRIGKGKNALTSQELYQVRSLSLSLLMQRLYYTDEQQTYTVVDLPLSILRVFNHTHVGKDSLELNDFHDTRQESSFFFVHRESLYALAQFFGWRYQVPGLPPGEVPVAASLIMEKLMPEHEQYLHTATTSYIRLTLYTPNNGIHTLPVPGCRIPELCEMRELRAIYDTRVRRTGTWEKLCNYVPQEIDHTTDIR